jgi:DNA-binding IclR family transcriptional regulator
MPGRVMKKKKIVRTQGVDSRYVVPPVQRALRLLRYIADGNAVESPSRAAKELAINRTTLVRLLATLSAERMIERRHDGEGYRLGIGMATLTARALFSADIVQVADPILANLANHLGLSSHFGILEGRDVIYVVRRVPNLHLVSNVRIGSRLPAHASNIGRVILAHMPRKSVVELYAKQTLERVTDKTVTTLDGLLRQIARDQEVGLAWSDSNFELGISSVAAPVFDHTGHVAGGINVSGATGALEGAARRKEISAALLEAAQEISRRIGYSPVAEPNAQRYLPR